MAFLRKHMSSPVSSRALGECNAIRSQGIRPLRVDLFCKMREICQFSRFLLNKPDRENEPFDEDAVAGTFSVAAISSRTFAAI